VSRTVALTPTFPQRLAGTAGNLVGEGCGSKEGQPASHEGREEKKGGRSQTALQVFFSLAVPADRLNSEEGVDRRRTG
jgi:hypothetical protein